MYKINVPLFVVVTVAAAGSTLAQTGQPGAPDASRVRAGNYTVDKNHTQVIWTVNHLGITPLSGSFGASGGTLQLDPANLPAAKVTVTFNIADMSTNAPAFTRHLISAQIFDAAQFPTATFTSTSVQASGDSAKITGNLTLRGVTKPVTLDAKFFGAGTNPQSKKLQVGFSGKAALKRSDFGLGYGLPGVADNIVLQIHAAFDHVG